MLYRSPYPDHCDFNRGRGRPVSGFTLVELIVVIAVVAILAAILLPALSGVRERAKVSGSLANVRALAQGVHLYANDNGGRFPKWSTSGGSEGWFLTLRPYVEGEGVSAWVHPAFADPLDERPPPSSTTNHQIGWKLSVITTQGHASAPGGAARSAEPRLLTEIKDPANTILFAPNMWHTRESWQNADQIQSLFDRLNGKATYAFIDGHAELLALEETYDPAQGIDRWSDQ